MFRFYNIFLFFFGQTLKNIPFYIIYIWASKCTLFCVIWMFICKVMAILSWIGLWNILQVLLWMSIFCEACERLQTDASSVKCKYKNTLTRFSLKEINYKIVNHFSDLNADIICLGRSLKNRLSNRAPSLILTGISLINFVSLSIQVEIP